MNLRQDPTWPSHWLVFDDEGHLVARGHLELASLPHAEGAGSTAIVEFVPDWQRENESGRE